MNDTKLYVLCFSLLLSFTGLSAQNINDSSVNSDSKATFIKKETKLSFPVTDSTEEAPVICLYTKLWSLREIKSNPVFDGTASKQIESEEESKKPVHNNRVIVAIWNDGKVIWSEDKKLGGPPYKEGAIPTDKIDFFLEKLTADDSFSKPELNLFYANMHDPYAALLIQKSPEESIAMYSSHVVSETERPGYVDLRGGNMEKLEYGKLKDDVLFEKADPKYHNFRIDWKNLSGEIIGMIPEGEDKVSRTYQESELNFGIKKVDSLVSKRSK